MSDSEGELGIFEEPEGFYEAEKQPSFVEYTLPSGLKLNLRLVGHNALWGHFLWNAGRTIASHFESNPQLVKAKTVLELGAGAGLPSLISAHLSAKQVVVTDYPDADLIDNLSHNIDTCAPSLPIVAKGYLWGADTSTLIEKVKPDDGFDVLILADLLFNHSEHGKLLQTVQQSLKKDGTALVFFTPYRPWLLEKDLAFFDLARENGFIVDKVLEKVMDKVMFEEDPGDELLRRTVFGYEMRWA
ncbi:hypothetical protein AUEXF2481DRAFT_551 [Aureobasidium subglaciale EXF-2481]|uniref:Protein N-terminal and lysine N-methyltransferase EFM7 n=1 Tax=Aureobasidium subglaciale (strain EXF-2481) TaxID=1043005 RepID=A0A074YSD6_AURSE|nr:uncharacterized protein AUEXF2481DRAFT_551 [Aureobasidium subglaciale EXF-2481]KER00639.1 hypothetical protein AUEXF2481DRAFT_551 [Aureobasidium subglaciale EXF-2481]